jgi:hypothetical protein
LISLVADECGPSPRIWMLANERQAPKRLVGGTGVSRSRDAKC